MDSVCGNMFFYFPLVKEKFSIPLDTLLKVTDETGTEVDQDVFADLTTSKDICFVIEDECDCKCFPVVWEVFKNYFNGIYRDYILNKTFTVFTASFSNLSSPSLTDTMSMSSSSKESDSDGFNPFKRIRREEALQDSAAKDVRHTLSPPPPLIHQNVVLFTVITVAI